jgi:hypothetical protein
MNAFDLLQRAADRSKSTWQLKREAIERQATQWPLYVCLRLDGKGELKSHEAPVALTTKDKVLDWIWETECDAVLRIYPGEKPDDFVSTNEELAEAIIDQWEDRRETGEDKPDWPGLVWLYGDFRRV